MQAAREAARRMQCTNKLKQLALAAHNYHDVQLALPAAEHNNRWSPTSSNSNRWSGFPSLFPYLELAAQFDELKTLAISDPSAREGTLGTLRVAILQPFLCPSSSGNKKQPTWVTRTNYRFCWGDNAQHHWLSTSATDNYLRGCFGYLSWYNFAAITDGTSNTLFFSEREVADTPLEGTGHAPTRKVKTDSLADYSGVFGGGTTAANPSFLSSRSTCMNAVGTGGEYLQNAAVNTALRCYHGLLWDGVGFETGFTTITPPNGPSCTRTGNLGYMIAPSSNHSGGVNTALGDGAVKFISDTINIGSGDKFDGDVRAMGQSPFGVWGALGSRAGGESTTL
ncbi:MAG: DUF1559 domain-containing protein [Planctomycetaceae bacterium]|nr:DUF1559 domain-containing protein [Planctomycetaceae bacterium]